MKKRLLAVVLASTMALGLFAGCSSEDTSNNDSGVDLVDGKVGVVLGVGGLGDQSFNDLVYQGLQNAKNELGVDFDYAEPTQVTDFEIIFSSMVSSDEYEVILGIGFDSVDALTKIANENPDQKFALIDGEIDLPNVASYMAKEEEGAFLAGTLAGLMKNNASDFGVEDNGHVGFLAANDAPILLKWNAGYFAGAKYVNDNTTLSSSFVGGDNPFGDTATAKEISIGQYNKGADIQFHAAGGAGLGMFDAATDYDFIAIGCNSNQNTINPDNIVASVLKKVDVASYDIAKSACIDNNLRVGQTVIQDLSDGGMDLDFANSNIEVSQEIKDEIEAIKEKIIAGEIVVPSTMEEAETFSK